MLNIRSKNLVEYAVRILFVILLGLAVHCAVAVAKGGGGKSAFDFGNPERRRTLLVVVLAIGAAAVVMLPTPGTPSGERKVAGGDDKPAKAEPESASAKASDQSETIGRSTPTAQPDSAAPTASIPLPDADEQPEKDVPKSPREELDVSPASPASPVQADALPMISVRPARSAARKARVSEMVERKWRAARKIQHNFIPDLIHDGPYLRLVYEAAMSGHPKAQAKLGDYAYRRRALIEAYYWMRLSCLNGCADAEPNLKACRDRWKRRGCQPEYGNVSSIFTERQSSLGRALIRLDCDVMPQQSLAKVKAMSVAGDAVAKMILDAMAEREDV